MTFIIPAWNGASTFVEGLFGPYLREGRRHSGRAVLHRRLRRFHRRESLIAVLVAGRVLQAG